MYRDEKASAKLGGSLPGVFAEYILLDEQGAVLTPDYLSDVEASTLPVAAVTAWSAPYERCHLQPGQTVFVQGTGGVALFAAPAGARLRCKGYSHFEQRSEADESQAARRDRVD